MSAHDIVPSKSTALLMMSGMLSADCGCACLPVERQLRTASFADCGSACRQEDAVIKGIERRISYVTHIPEVNGEGLQILHYEDGQKYEAHHDFFHDKFNSRPENGGQRIATVLMYL